MQPGGLEDVPRALEVRRERGGRAPEGGTDDRLGAEMDDRVDLVLDDGALDGPGILEVAVDQRGSLQGAAAQQLRLWIHIPDERDHVRALIDEAPGQPRPHHTGGAGHEHPMGRPGAHDHTRQGAAPESHRLLRSTDSR